MHQKIRPEVTEYATNKRLAIDEHKECLQGVVRDEKKDLFKYYLKIDVRPWPYLFPQVWELDNQIAWEADNHTFPNDGMLCLDTRSRQSYLINSKQVTSLLQWHEEVLMPHLARQYDYHNGDKDAFKGEELSHGVKGIIEGYHCLLQTDMNTVISILPYIYNKELWTDYRGKLRNSKCPCNSGLKVKYCTHEQSPLNLFIKPRLFQEDLDRIRQWLYLKSRSK